LTPRYAFKFPLFKSDSDAPKFEPHPFWTVMSSKAGCPLVKLACICHSTEAKYTEEEAAAALTNGLRPFVRPLPCSPPLPSHNPSSVSPSPFWIKLSFCPATSPSPFTASGFS
jgi:hypothetical protein